MRRGFTPDYILITEVSLCTVHFTVLRYEKDTYKRINFLVKNKKMSLVKNHLLEIMLLFSRDNIIFNKNC